MGDFSMSEMNCNSFPEMEVTPASPEAGKQWVKEREGRQEALAFSSPWASATKRP